MPPIEIGYMDGSRYYALEMKMEALTLRSTVDWKQPLLIGHFYTSTTYKYKKSMCCMIRLQ